MLVTDEYEWAGRKIEESDLGKKPTETLMRVAKHYFADGYDKEEVRDKLENFLLSCDPNASLCKWSDTLDGIIRRAMKYPPICVSGVNVSKKEMDTIDTLDTRPVRMLAFTLLCVSKYWDTVNYRNNHWVNTSDKEIMKMANVVRPVKTQSKMFAELEGKKLIAFSKRVDNLNVRVLFSDKKGDVALSVDDFRNLGNQYRLYHGEDFFTCANCGLTVKRRHPEKGRRQKYCDGCAVAIHTKKAVEAVTAGRSFSNVSKNAAEFPMGRKRNSGC